ncbi:MAG: polyphosphate polymerase domain-containing protein [Bacteroidales bacterium]|nr:polyphosphate polymerase domain-containing protein [Bacteroidales bacterium]
MISKELNNIMGNFNSVSLNDIDGLEFLNRCDTKFPFPLYKAPELFEALNGDYKILEIGSNKLFGYKTTYFDTDDFELFVKHQNGKFNRYKLRYREYIETETSYLELKFKNNKGKTLKKRIKYELGNELTKPAIQFLKKTSPLYIPDYKPKMTTFFNRLTFVSFKHKERITFDYNLSFKELESRNEENLPFLAIAELKNEGFGNKSNFYQIMKSLGILPSGMSKYCVGMSLLNDSLKKNNFKPKLRMLNKIKNDNELFTGLYA